MPVESVPVFHRASVFGYAAKVVVVRVAWIPVVAVIVVVALVLAVRHLVPVAGPVVAAVVVFGALAGTYCLVRKRRRGNRSANIVKTVSVRAVVAPAASALGAIEESCTTVGGFNQHVFGMELDETKI